MNIKTNFRQILDSVYSNETISGSLEYAFNPSEPFPNKGMLYIWDNEAKEYAMIAGTKIPNGANRIEDVDFLNKFKLVATEYDLIK